MQINFKIPSISWGWIACAALIICFWWRECHAPHDTVIDHSGRDSALSVIAANDIKYLKDMQGVNDSLLKINVDKGQIELRLNESENKLDASVSYSRFLAKELQDAKDLIEDTGMIAVSPRYIEYCDTCAEQLLKQSALVVAYKADVEERDRLHTKEISLKDTVFAIERRSNIQERAAFELMKRGYNKLATESVPRNAVYAGFVAQGNQTTVLQGLGMGATLVTKQGKLYGVDAIMVNNADLLFQARAQFKITFRQRKN